ncbi:MAG: hypothetical protein ACXV5H_07830 [Halobacteriota archaeon]
MDAVELSALTQFIANVSVALDAGYDVPPAEMRGHIERGDVIPFLTAMCCDNPNLMVQLFREHWTARTEHELVELLRGALEDETLGQSFHKSGMCYLIALTTGLIERGSFRG